MERSPQFPFQKLNFGSSSQKTRKSRYQTFLVLSSFTGFLYFVPNILPRIVKKGGLKICSKFTGEHKCQSVLSMKLLCNFIDIFTDIFINIFTLLISLIYWYLYFIDIFTVFIKHLWRAVSENSNLKNVAIWKCNNICDGLIFSTYIALTVTSHQEKITLYLNSFPNSETIECESNCYKNSSYLKTFLYSENVKVTTKSWYFQI